MEIEVLGGKITEGGDLSQKIRALISAEKTFTVTDNNVYKIYRELFCGKEPYIIEAGEDSKSLENVGKIAEAMLKKGVDRSYTLIAVGGGVVGDLVGFCASVYMRGIKWINVPTTLLAEVDSGIGGKTAVDLKFYKNIIGSFYNPSEVIISRSFLSTLNKRERLCGIGEVVKTACLDKNIYALLEKNIDLLIKGDKSAYEIFVPLCAAFKAKVVNADFKESGSRKILNLGHTVGHAVETCDNHKQSHGEYVLMGLKAEAFLFSGDIDAEFYKSLNGIIDKCGISVPDFDAIAVAAVSLKDKKNSEGEISVMSASRPGEVTERKIRMITMEEGLEKWKKSLLPR